VTSARSGEVQTQGDDRFLVLDRGQRNEADVESGEKTVARFESYSILVGEKALQRSDNLPAKARSSLELAMLPTPRHQGELTWRLGLVIGGANLLLLGVGLAATNPRRASNWNLLIALLGFIVYSNLINLTQAWVANGRLDMGAALLAIHGGVFALALVLLWWRDHASTFALRSKPA